MTVLFVMPHRRYLHGTCSIMCHAGGSFIPLFCGCYANGIRFRPASSGSIPLKKTDSGCASHDSGACGTVEGHPVRDSLLVPTRASIPRSAISGAKYSHTLRGKGHQASRQHDFRGRGESRLRNRSSTVYMCPSARPGRGCDLSWPSAGPVFPPRNPDPAWYPARTP